MIGMMPLPHFIRGVGFPLHVAHASERKSGIGSAGNVQPPLLQICTRHVRAWSPPYSLNC